MTAGRAVARLSEEERRWLLAFARRVIRAHVDGEPTPEPGAHAAALDDQAACFVTVHDACGALRGCIGTFAAERPLWRAVRDMAVAASSHDPRFSPMTTDEVPTCRLEISVLSPRRPIDPDDVQVGRDGLSIEHQGRRGVLLPQVAVEYGWDRSTFLAQVCRKAGLPGDTWRDPDARLESFGAEVFAEPTTSSPS